MVDPEAAEVVKRIFAMTIDGYGPYQIASKLKSEKVLIPSAYLAQHGEGVNKNKTFKDVYGWGSSTICNILEKREYLGHTINFKTRKHFKDKKSHYVPEDEWTIFENTHEPIIDQQTFDLVQKIRGNVRRYPDGWGEAAPLTGLLYCADCGGKMYVHRTNNGKRISQYTCSQYTKVPCGTLCKTQHRINEDVVLSLVSEMLKAIAEYAKHDRAEFVRVVQEAQSSQQTAEVRKQRTRLATAKQRVSELEVLLCKIYEDNILGKLSDSRYATLDAQYAKEQAELTAEISTLEKAIKSYETHEKDADRFIALIDKYENFDKLTIAILNEFIEKILVHERDRKGSIQTTQEVEIYFNFVRPGQQFTAERADERSTNSMNITYTQNGDYLIPNIVIRKTKPLGHYGRLRKAYLEMHRPILFNELVLSDKLFEHCAEIDEAARNRMELIVRSLAEQNGVTEQLKAENQMEWVRQMNACKAQAEEIVKAELIYD